MRDREKKKPHWRKVGGVWYAFRDREAGGQWVARFGAKPVNPSDYPRNGDAPWQKEHREAWRAYRVAVAELYARKPSLWERIALWLS